jgi:hypothetical protein
MKCFSPYALMERQGRTETVEAKMQEEKEIAACLSLLQNNKNGLQN